MELELNSKFEKLIKGQASYQSTNLGYNLLISRLQKKYQTNQTAAELSNCLQEMKAFFEKYRAIMTTDIEALKNL